jgi:multiple sugar transport system substrate-binding protein
MAVKLTKKAPDGSIDVAGFVPLFNFYENTASHIAPSFGATWLTDEGKSNLAADPAWKQMLEWQRSLADQLGVEALQKFNAGKGEEFSADNAFQQGKVAMMIDGEWRIAFIKDQAPDLEFGTAPFPVPDDATDRYGAGYVTGNIMGISKGSDNKEAAWALIKYLTLDDDAIVKLANGIKNIPTTEDSLASPKLEVDDNFQTFLDIFSDPNTQTSPSTANGAVYQTQFDSFLEKWQRGEVSDVDAGLHGVDEEIDAALQLGQAP